ncbi:MAG: helix-turn-helix domain-containing protein [Thermoproteus sp. AZ2]|uniref:Helix-turn-helix domain-containing protein n=1 Tax=Thermoproteus sp. AZ2 TaxID=1609232 RepID=A0ACC6V0A1_9CREN|nr:MAG: hypothetical protein TU35_05085 [Thermoproteus sp. AZ2]
MRLTSTEQKVVDLYNSGLRPREIANRLGISINTVYKALSKYRRISEAEASPPTTAPADGGDQGQGSNGPSYYAATVALYSSSVLYAHVPQPPVDYRELSALVKRLEDLLERLEKLIEGKPSVEATKREVAVAEAPSVADMGSDLPDFIRRNAWVKVLRGRANVR